jgi:DNA-binding transcriptional LysR family regulator
VPKRLAILYADALGLDTYEFPIDVPPVPLYLMWSKAFEQDPSNQWLIEKLRFIISNTK